MTELNTESKIAVQREKVFAENPALELVAPCKVGEGIFRPSVQQKEQFVVRFKTESKKLTFFIPASGAGSRMFQFLYEFLETPNDDNRALAERFINSIEDFAFFKYLPLSFRRSIIKDEVRIEDLVAYLLDKDGMNFSSLPKGLVPFHTADPFVLNPFQEQLLQGAKLEVEETKFHFTIQSAYNDQIKKSISFVEGMFGQNFDVSFSEQSKETDSYAFLEDQSILKDDKGNAVTRPAGHGALLANLNALSEELIFVKNIDNVQHFSKSEMSVEALQMLGGILLEFRKQAKKLFREPNAEGLKELNETYQVFSDTDLTDQLSSDEIRAILNRPLRVCGMVKNEGQPGGGPFWVKENGKISKQIVEKAQISTTGEQFRLMVQSTHFNPVIMAVCPLSMEDEKLDLNDFKDASKYFIVNKTQQGKKIKYMELPGLWNGSMANWNTIFVELPSSVFSPVKTVLDLLGDQHNIK
jgi:hypothetical protein